MTFHWRDGWFFERTSTPGRDPHEPGVDLGIVHITKWRDGIVAEGNLEMEAYIPAAEWASIIASVSVFGETADSWPLAVAFHMGGTPLVPSR